MVLARVGYVFSNKFRAQRPPCEGLSRLSGVLSEN